MSGRTGSPDASACVRLTALQLLSASGLTALQLLPCVRGRSCGPEWFDLYSRPVRQMPADPSVRCRCPSELSPMKVSVKARTFKLTTLQLLSDADSPPCSYCWRSRTLSGLFRTVQTLSSIGRGPTFHLHLYPAKLVRSISPCMYLSEFGVEM